MADVRCHVCGATNRATAQFCESCGVQLNPQAAKGTDVDRLLEQLVESKVGASAGEGLDIDKEIVDELLDSLLVEEEAPEYFDCPLCGARLPLEAKVCTKCGATFAEVAPGEEVKAKPPAAAAPAKETAGAAPEGAVPVSLTEETAGSIRIWSGRMIDLVVFGTIGALFAVFLGFQMYRWSALAANPAAIIIFGAVAIGGVTTGFILFRVSTSAIAQGDQMVKDGRYEDALYYYDRAIRMGAKPASAWTSKGVAMKRLGRLDEAVRCHNAALKLDPENEIAWCNKGDCYFRAGQMESAIECYNKAIGLREKYAIAWNNKGAALARMGLFEDARTCHDMAVKLKPRYVAAWLNRGEVLARLGMRAEAEQCLERARALGAGG